MSEYVFVTFAPIQSFIEKSRKLRDLYGASLILSHLSSKLIRAAQRQGAEVISPGLPKFTQGMPNRILIKGDFSEKAAREALFEAWSEVLEKCRTYLEQEVTNFCSQNLSHNQNEDINHFCQLQKQNSRFYTWEPEWDKWKNHTWELFWAEGDTPDEARQNIEIRKLSRQWTAINWMGESSSISGADAIAYPRLEAKDIDIRQGFPFSETRIIRGFYKILAIIFDENKNHWKEDMVNTEIEGKFIADNERLSIPELVKRLVTHPDVGKPIGIEPPKKFKDIVRLARNTGQDIPGHWTGWFIGDGDRMGDHLIDLARKGGSLAPSMLKRLFSYAIKILESLPEASLWEPRDLEFFFLAYQVLKNQRSDNDIRQFSEIMRTWGKDFQENFPANIGRIIYAGGDDFMGIIYSGKPENPIPGYQAFEELIKLHQKWQSIQPVVQPLLNKEVNKEVTVSVGFVWVGAGVPQRDVLQHCREAQKRAKNLGRDRVTIRVVFNNGQYVEWTTPWKYLNILNSYRDLNEKSSSEANWSHVYGDLAQLKANHAFGLGIGDLDKIEADFVIQDYRKGILEFLEIYFPGYKEKINSNLNQIFSYVQPHLLGKKDKELISWVENMIIVGWHLLSARQSSDSL